jgi:hypothetical protein
MAGENLYQELKDVLQDFKTFLDDNVPTIKPAILALASLIPEIVDLIDLLIDLMGDIKTEIENLDVSDIPALSQVSEFTEKISNFLDASADLLPDDADGTVEDIRSAISVVGGLPSLDEVKQDILDLIGDIVTHLNSLKPA